ncbi:MAG: RNA polymerase sigma factor [Acidobacteriaceae bacterium]|nr:RNA polymerase sigma factor [Acidobacteriaceae bacterium]MBV9498372.1 RNA polymerase sigma factor [Acidobacteriaceae bacterium]
MESVGNLAMAGAVWETDLLEDTSVQRLILEQYDREQLSLRRYVAFLGIDPETAFEIVQECFLKLQEHLLARGDRTNLRAWLYRVAHNLARNSQSAFRSSRTDFLADVTLAGDPPARSNSAEQDLLARERLDLMNSAIQALSPAQRDCLVLRSQGLKYREIADVLNLSTSTVGENIQRGLEKLKELL